MALPSTLIDIPVSKGLDTKTDNYLVSAPYLTSLQNGVFTKGGTIVKRNGYSPLGTGILGGGNVTTGAALATFDNELLQVTSTGELYSYNQSTNQWIDRGQVSPVVETESQIIRNTYTQSNPDIASAGGVTVCVWDDTRGGIRASAFDEVTRAAILSDVSISATGTAPQLTAVGSTICLVYKDTGGLMFASLNASAPTAWTSPVVLDTTIVSSPIIDAWSYDGASFVVAWTGTSTTTRVAIVLPTGQIANPVNGYPSPTNISMNCSVALEAFYDATNSLFWFYGASSSGLYACTLTTGFTQPFAPVQVDASASVVNVTSYANGGTSTVWYEITAGLTYNHLTNKATVTTGGVASAPAVFIRSVGLGSEVFAQGGTPYLLVNFSSPLQPTTFLVRGDTGYVIGKGQPGLSGGLYTAGRTPRFFSPSANTWSVPIPTRVQLVNTTTSSAGAVTSYTSYFLVGIDRLDITFGGVDAFRSAQVGENLHFAGGFLAIYDGQSVTEAGFHLYPEGVTATASASGGSMADGTYTVQVVWGWQDARGQIHRSAPSPPIQFTISGGGGSGSATLTIPTLRITSKSGSRTAPVAMVYRTPANGTLLQRVGNGSADAVTAPVYSTTSSDTVSFSLTTFDAQIAANEILYTTGGVLANMSPPPVQVLAASKNRLFLGGVLGTPNQVWFSQPWIQGQPISFSPYLTMSVDARGGGVTALATVDATVVVYKEEAIYAFAGDGPDLTGSNNLFSQPQFVTSDVGCTNPDAIATMPRGMMFETSKGIYLLDRSLSVQYIGAPVEAFNADVMTGGVLVDGVNQVRFASSNGATLVYDYYFDQWGTFTNCLAVDAISWSRVQGAVATYAYLNTTGTVMLETAGVYLDNQTPIALSLTTAWIHVAHLQGFFKLPWVTVLGKFYSSNTLRVGVSYDYQGFASEYHSFTSGLGTEVYGTNTYGTETPYGGVSNTVYQFRFRPSTSKMQAVQFSFSELSPSSGQGFALSGLTLQVAQLPVPFKKLGAASTVGAS